MKKAVSLFLSVVMLFCVTFELNISVFAQTLTSGYCGEHVSYSFDSLTGVLNIQGYGDMYNCYYDDEIGYLVSPPFYNNKQITKIVINEGVESIGVSIFVGCSNVKTVSIPGSVTKFYGSAFNGCTGIEKYIINPENKDYISTEKGAVYNKDKTKIIAYPAMAPAKKYTLFKTVTEISEGVFCNCKNLEELTIPKSVTHIKAMGIGDNNSIKTINYKGKVSDWTKIKIDFIPYYLDEGEPEEPELICCNDCYDNYYYGNNVLLNVFEYCEDGMALGKHEIYLHISQPTFYHEGYKQYSCRKCDYSLKEEKIPKLKSPSLSSVTKGKKSFVAKWKSVSGIDGYQIQYSRSKSFSKYNKTVTVSGYKSTKKTVNRLKAKKKYYVRIRGYKYINGVKNYSPWSSKKTVTTKK